MSSGLVLIDKPKDWTSHDVVAKMRGVLGTRKVGHAGTLDPMATGLLILGVNQGTKLLQYLLGQDNSYTARIRLGQTTLSADAESEVLESFDAGGHLTNKKMKRQSLCTRTSIHPRTFNGSSTSYSTADAQLPRHNLTSPRFRTRSGVLKSAR